MRIAYLECFSGISGDMLLGALADAGAPASELAAVPEKLGLSGASVRLEKTKRSHISAIQAHVEEGDKSGHPHRSLSAIEKMIAGSSLSEHTRQTAIAVFRRLGAAEARVHNVPLEESSLS